MTVTGLEAIARTAVDCGYHIHAEFGPGLLESVYELLMVEALRERGFEVTRQVPIPLRYKSLVVEQAFKADIIVAEKLLLEIKSTESHAPVHAKQVLTYLRLTELPLGLLMNFGMASYKDGIKRLANRYYRNVVT